MERKIKIFSFAAVLMLAVSVIGCKHNVTNNTPETCSVTFGVDGTGGTLKAKVEGGSEINSGNTVEHGKTVIFTAEPSDNYEVDKWTITGSAFETGTGIGGSTTAKVKITATVNITVSFKLKNYTVTFSVDGAGGTLKATADGVAETETSPITVEHGKTVTLTAVPTVGYKVKEWKLNGNAINGTNPSYTHTITQAVNVTVSFELGKAILTLDPNKLTIKVKAKTKDGSVIEVEGCNETTLASDAETELHAKETTVTLKGYITELNCYSNKLTELNVQGLTALQKLDCRSNTLTVLDVHGLTKLEKLDCNVNELTTLDVSGLTKLQELNCSRNQLTALDVSGLTALQELNCRSNKIPELNVQGLTKLQQLKCGGNQLASLNVQGCTALQELNCRTNQIPELNVQGLTKLQKLDCGGNQLTALDVSGLTALQKLYCNDSRPHVDRYLSELNVQGCTSLKELRCYYNKLDANAFIKIFNDLPTREASDGAKAVLYKDRTASEENCKDFTQPESLKKAFENARDVKHWKLQKLSYDFEEDI